MAASDYTNSKSIAVDPNTSPQTLLRLAKRFPQEVLENLTFTQILRENPNLLNCLDKNVVLRLLKQDRVSSAFLEWAANSHDNQILLAVASHANTPLTALEKLISTQQPTVVEAAKLHINWKQEVNEDLQKVLIDAITIANLKRTWKREHKLFQSRLVLGFILSIFDEDIRLKAAQDLKTSANILTQLIMSLDKYAGFEIRKAVAKHLHTPQKVLEELVGDEDSNVHEAVINNPNISVKVIQEFYKQKQTVLDPDTSSEKLTELANSRWDSIRLSIARHHNAHGDVLASFGLEEDWRLRLAVAFNLNTPAATLEQLIMDQYWEVRWAVAQNPNTPIDILEKLLRDNDQTVIEVVENRLKNREETSLKNSDIILSRLIPHEDTDDGIKRMDILSKEISEAREAYVRIMKVAQLSDVVKDIKENNWRYRVYLFPVHIPINIIQELADSQDSCDRQNVAGYYNTPRDILVALATDESPQVRVAVARNVNTPIVVLEELSKDEDSGVCRAIATNRNTPFNLLQQLLMDEKNGCRNEARRNLIRQILYNPNISEILLQQFLLIQDKEITVAVARHPNTTVNMLQELGINAEVKVRQAVAQNPNTPKLIMERLTQDEHLYVRNAAMANLNPHASQNLVIIENNIEDKRTKLLKKCAQDSTSTVARLIALFYSKTPQDSLIKNFRSTIWLERYAIAQNSNTPCYIIQKLTQDGNRIVRAAAEANLAQKPIELSENTEQTGNTEQTINILQNLGSLFRGEQVSIEYLEWAASLSGRKVLRAIANHPNTPKSILAKLTTSKYPEVAQSALLHVNWRGEIDKGWDELGKRELYNNILEINTEQMCFLSKIGVVDELILKQLVENSNQDTYKQKRVLLVVVSASNIPTNILQKLANQGDDYLRLWIARNPHTPTNILEQLSQHIDINIQYSVAANPNTSSNTLANLAKSHDMYLDKILLENPNTLPQVVENLKHIQQLYQKANDPDTPLTELEILVDSEYDEIRRAVAQNPNTPIDILEKLAKDKNRTIIDITNRRIERLAMNPNISASILERLSARNDSSIWRRLAENPNTPINILQQFAAYSDNEIRWAVIKNPSTPERVLEQLATDIMNYDMYSLEEITKQPNIPLSVLEKLSRSEYALVQRSVASNPKTPVSILQEMMELIRMVPDFYSVAYVGIAQNPNTPIEMLEELVKYAVILDYKNEVLIAVASNPNTPIELLEYLADISQDPHNTWTMANEETIDELLIALVENPRTPVKLLERLAKSSGKNIRYFIAKNARTPLSVLEELFTHHQNYFGLAHNPQLPLHIAENLLNSEDVLIKRIILENNLSITPNILKKFAIDNNISIRKAVARHPNTPISSLSQLAADTDSDVRKAVTRNPNQLTSLVQEVNKARYTANYSSSETELSSLALSSWQWVHVAVAGNANTAVNTLQYLAEEKISYITQDCSNLEYRCSQVFPTLQALAKNPRTTARILEQLLFDNQNLRRAIAQHPNISGSLLEQLLFDNQNLRRTIAQHPNISGSLLEQLLSVNDQNLAEIIAQNPNTSINVLEKLIKNYGTSVRKIAVKNYITKYPEGLPLVLGIYAKAKKPDFSLFIVLLHRQTPAKFLAKKANSLFWWERYAIAQNLNTPSSILQKLSEDANSIVRAAAKANLGI